MTLEKARAFWLELQRGLRYVHVLRQPPASRRRRTGEMRVTITERRAMQAFHLLYGESYTVLARRFRRDRHHMPRWIWEPQYRAFHAYYWGTNDSEQPRSRCRETVAVNAAGAAA
jgi:hypothetical protein